MLIHHLQKPACYDHAISYFQLIETHISWVILTGDYAYKIKKPVNMGFLDFSTLEKRQFYCHEELRLGRLLAPEIYLDLIPIRGSPQHPQLWGDLPIIDYAIKMREFPQATLLTQVLAQGQLTEPLIIQLAKKLADFHQTTPVTAPETVFGTPQQVHGPVIQNFDQIRPLIHTANAQQLNTLQHWSEQQWQRWYAIFEARKQQGFIRDCHGDLHLANVIFYQEKIILVDRLEFNDDFRWTDVMADLAFLVMDLTEKNHPTLATQLINEYLLHTQDYQGLALLPYYAAYRAMVRAKTSLFRLNQAGLSPEEQQQVQTDYQRFIALASHYTQSTRLLSKPVFCSSSRQTADKEQNLLGVNEYRSRLPNKEIGEKTQFRQQSTKPTLILTHGLSGSGKTTQAKQWATTQGAIHLRADIIRKQLHGLAPDAQTHSPVYANYYTPEATHQTYQRLLSLAEQVLQAGYSVVVDASFLQLAQRKSFYELATRLQLNCAIFACEAPLDALHRRIQHRKVHKKDASEARSDILDAQIKQLEPLTETEKRRIIQS